MTTDAPLFLGDEIAAAGWRLAGLRTFGCEPGREDAAFEHALGEASCVLLSAACAARIDAPRLQRALAATAPLVVVVPDLQGRAPLPDLAERLRAQLGMAPP
jgi:vacuolar-type H+-ATPase subunit F/Vma7